MDCRLHFLANIKDYPIHERMLLAQTENFYIDVHASSASFTHLKLLHDTHGGSATCALMLKNPAYLK